jgi:aryl-alcohol dehydrogenase-like predicted oxidoreductase
MLMRFAHGPETIRVGDFEVRRLGFGAMRLPGKDVWGEPADPATAHAVLRRAIELGVNFIDTAWFYGPMVANRLIAEALHPYPTDLVIATKLGAKRGDDKSWRPALRPEELRVGIDDDLKSLRLEQLPCVHLRWPGADRAHLNEVSFATALDVLIHAQREGKIRHIALSNVTVEQLGEAEGRTTIVAVQNLFPPGAAGTAAEAMLTACEERKIAFIPFSLPTVGVGIHPNEATAKRMDCSPAQLTIAWLLARSPVMLPIPGTSRIKHLEDNIGAVHVPIDEVTHIELGR